MFDKKGLLPYSVKQGRRIRMCMACSGQFSFRADAKQDLIHFYLDSCNFFSCSLHKSVYRQESFHQRNAVHAIAPTYIQNLVSLKSQGTYNLRSSGGILLASPTFRTKVTLGDRSFQVAAPKLWNALPRELRDIPNLHTFKRNLKTYLFKFAYVWMNFNCYISIFRFLWRKCHCIFLLFCLL